jgi:hypothetical protein
VCRSRFPVLLMALVALGFSTTQANSQELPTDRIKKSVDAFLANRGPESRDAAAAAWDCLAAVSVAPEAGPAARDRVIRAANALVATRDLEGDGKVGWTYDPQAVNPQNCKGPGTLATFNQGTCNPRYVKYMFQTGLAATCLARAYELTKDKTYLDTARAAIDDSWEKGVAPEKCPSCFSYWYSYHTNDRGRYARDVNALMGMAVAWLYHATNDGKYRQRAQAVANQELRELAAGNQGHLSIDDPVYKRDAAKQSAYTENHMLYVAKGLFDIGRILNEPNVIQAAASAMLTWMNCSSQTCRRHRCDIWAAGVSECHDNVTAGPCFLRSLGKPFSAWCTRAAATYKTFSNYKIWAIYDH